MDATFYDVKLRKKVQAKVTEKVEYGEKEGKKRYALKGLTKDGRKLITFVNKETFDKYEA